MARIRSRKRPRRLKNQVILFVDGEVEIEYLKHIEINRYDNVRFNVKKGNENDFINILHDEIPKMLILDIDAVTKRNDPKKRYNNIKYITKDKDIKKDVFFNNYSFETFLLLHVKDFTKRILKIDEYNKDMKAEFDIKDSWSNKKNKSNIQKVFLRIDQKSLKTALLRAKKLSSTFHKNPSSNMDKFFKRVEYYNKVDSE